MLLQTAGMKVVVRRFGSLYLCLSRETFDKLRRRVTDDTSPVYVGLPLDWGAGEVSFCLHKTFRGLLDKR